MNTPNTDEQKLPHWDMTVVYPDLESPAFAQGFAEVAAGIADLQNLFDSHGIAAPDGDLAIDAAVISTFDAALTRYNTLLDDVKTLRAYIGAFIATDSRNALAQAKMSALQQEFVTLSKLGTRFTAWVGALDSEALIAGSPLARDHAYFLHKTKTAAIHLMPPGEESLLSELYQSGGGAWAKLYGDFTSQMLVPLKDDVLPISAIRALASDSDREIRKAAYEAEITAWEQNALPLAAAMNAIKHETSILAAQRKWGSPLDVALFNNNIDRETLDAMLSAARASFPDFRRYLRAKARLISASERLPWYDLFAPVGEEDDDTWNWQRAESFVAEQFGTYSPKMRGFAERSFVEHWIDAEPRPGKRDGAFCMSLRGDESRILQNFKPAFGGVSTLAHELGHGYHNLCLAHRTPLQSGTPMTLAETASIFCETIIRQAALTDSNPAQHLSIIEASLQGMCQVVVDITSRFLFEQRLFERRTARELSVDELCELMRDAQIETYGDGMDENHLHPYMWAAKGHYYGSTFYNFPYMFGLLFGLGLSAQYEQDRDGFTAGYDDLLSSTGMGDAASLAERFGIDIRSEQFWSASLDVIRQDIVRFESAAAS